MNPVEFVQQLYEKEADPLLKFLILPLDDLDDHVRYAAYLHGKYSQKVQKLEEKYLLLKELRETKVNRAVRELLLTKDEQTGSYYTSAKAERIVACEPKIVAIKQAERQALFVWKRAKSYLSSLDRKLDMIPGKQGLYNKHYEVERDS